MESSGRRSRAGAAAMSAVVFALGLLCGCGEITTTSSPPEPPEVDAAQREQLEQLGYAQWTDDLDEESAQRAGVVHHDPTRAWPGLNLSSREHGSEAYLMDMQGRILHEWTHGDGKGWVVAKLQKNGELLVVDRRDAVLRLDWDSNLIWRADFWAHHDVSVSEADGLIYALRKRRDPMSAAPGVLLGIRDGLAVIDARGKLLREFDFNPLFPEASPAPNPEAVKAYTDANPNAVKGQRSGERFLDTLHTNSVLCLPRDVPGLGERGDLLISMRRISTLAVLDPQGLRVKWRWGPGEILGQHHPRLLDDDHLLIFDNGSPARPWSRIIEYSPAQDRIVWEYAADPPESFYSNSRGSAQRLPNGNVLVTNSTNGEVFEVTRDGEVVWRFLNPRFRKRDGRVQRETIFRMTRIHGAALESLPPLSARSDGARD